MAENIKSKKADILEKPEITIKSISGGIHETIKTGKYPNYFSIRSRKYNRSWRLDELPADLKIKGEVVYSVIDEFTVLDINGDKIDDVEFSMEMRD